MSRTEGTTDRDDAGLEVSLQRSFRYALSLTHDAAEAEDLVQDAVTAMLARGASWELSYLFKVIRNRFIDAYRRKQTVQFVSIESNLECEAAPDSADCLEAALLHQALAALRADERETLFLAVVEGYTAEEIARLCRRPRGTVLSTIFRARRKLRETLSTTSCGRRPTRASDKRTASS